MAHTTTRPFSRMQTLVAQGIHDALDDPSVVSPPSLLGDWGPPVSAEVCCPVHGWTNRCSVGSCAGV